MAKETLLEMIKNIEFEESCEIKGKCPKCKKGNLIRHIRREEGQSWGERWFVEYCEETDCDYFNTGFTPRDYKPPKDAVKIG